MNVKGTEKRGIVMGNVDLSDSEDDDDDDDEEEVDEEEGNAEEGEAFQPVTVSPPKTSATAPFPVLRVALSKKGLLKQRLQMEVRRAAATNAARRKKVHLTYVR